MEEKRLNHIGIIMDGNRRWARSRGLPAILGHREGVKAVERTLLAAKELGIPCVSLYAFSTENWKRPKSEVLGLMGLLKYYLKLKLEELNKENARIRFAGDISALSEDIQEILLDSEQKTRNNDSMQLVVCLNYGGRQEILDAVNKMIGDRVSLPVT
ncbi:MAG: di-trans,poly-cis-decaprenylcistransferase, partial [Synergistaceae bacterium]|nr:di-trans,poly-cis-decaprenylcistransferase [Synergistaceae bacterium]